ncbi:MAG: hypothetical protein Fues2KO_00750 [Fuerstiella sp.]
MAEEGKSISWIVGASLALVAYLGWGVMAGAWAGLEVEAIDMAAGTGRVRTARGFTFALMFSAVANFVIISVTELPDFSSVMAWHFTERIWVPILIFLLMGAVLGGGIALMRLEKTLAGPPKRKNRDLPPIPTPTEPGQKKRRRKKKRVRRDS